jgi:hypothetical protein
MMTHGIDFSGSPGGIEDTLIALRKAIRMLKQEGEI